jgi:hypothetical protein
MLLQIIGNRSQVAMGVGRLLLTLKKKPELEISHGTCRTQGRTLGLS